MKPRISCELSTFVRRHLPIIVLFAAAPLAHASTTCQPGPPGSGSQLCTSQVNFAKFAQQAYQSQMAPEWCWAASIAMIFSYYGHPVSQARIVSEVYGAPVNMPAQAGVVMAQQLNKVWVDDNNKWFSAKITGVYDANAGVYALTNEQIISELDHDHPLLFANTQHAVVLTAIQYYQTPYGPNVVAAGVFDPWPGIGARVLTSAELVPANQGGQLTFLATARVTDASPPSGGGTNATSDTNGGAVDECLLFVIGLLYVFARRSLRLQDAVM